MKFPAHQNSDLNKNLEDPRRPEDKQQQPIPKFDPRARLPTNFRSNSPENPPPRPLMETLPPELHSMGNQSTPALDQTQPIGSPY